MPIGGMGLSSNEHIPSDLEAIYQGGEFFLDRMKAMSAQQAEAEKALAALNLGNDVNSKLAGAEKALASAKVAEAEAQEVLKAARAKAEEIVAAANVQAKDIVDQANLTAGEVKAQADHVSIEANEVIAKARSKAAAIEEDIIVRSNYADQQAKNAQALEAQAKDVIASAERAKSEANEAKLLYQSKVDALRKIMAD